MDLDGHGVGRRRPCRCTDSALQALAARQEGPASASAAAAAVPGRAGPARVERGRGGRPKAGGPRQCGSLQASLLDAPDLAGKYPDGRLQNQMVLLIFAVLIDVALPVPKFVAAI